MEFIRAVGLARIFAVLAPILAPAAAFAAVLPTRIVPCNGVDCSVCHIATLTQNILNTSIFIAVVLSALLFAYAGWQAVTAGGDTEKMRSARSVFTNVFIGLVIILAGWIVVDTLVRTLTNASFGPWNKIC